MTTRNDAELSTLIRTTRDLVRDALRPDLDLDLFLADVLRRTHAITPFEVGWLLLREGDRVRIRAADEGHLGDVGMSFLVADCVSGQSMLRRAPIFIPDLAEMPAELRRVYKPSRSTARAMRSELVVPLLISDGTVERAIGALNIESPEPHGFAADQIEVLRLLADHAALAIELARSRQEAAALSAISLQLARETELGDIVRTVLERALGLVGGRFGQMLLTDGADLVVHYTTNAPPRELGLRFGLHDSVSGLAVQERRPVIVPDVSQAAYFVVERGGQGRPGRLAPRVSPRPQYQRVLEREKARIRAEFAAPLWGGGIAGKDRSIVGILNVETPREEGFSEAQRERLAALAEQRGDVFCKSLVIGDGAALRTLLDEALLAGATTFGQLLEIDGDELVIVATTGGEPVGTRVSAAGSVSGEVLARHEAYYVPDVDAEPRYCRYLGEEMKSELAVPLISGDAVLGVLNLESPAPGFFTAEHGQILQALAGQAALAVERTRRFEVERLAAIGGLAGDIVHRLNNPLGALSGWLDMLKRKEFYAELIAAYPYVEQFVSRAERDVTRAKSIVQELRAELKRQAPTAVSLQGAIVEALTRAGLNQQEDAAAGTVRIDAVLPPEPIRVLAGPSLAGIFWNLFDNAAKAMPQGGTLTVWVSRGPGGDRATVEVRDTGVGIEPWRLASIFEPAASTTADSYAPAHGLGLWWTKSQVESFGGIIDVSSQPGAGHTLQADLSNNRVRRSQVSTASFAGTETWVLQAYLEDRIFMIPNRILVIDDDPSWQELLAESIEAAGAAPPGELTVRIARSFQEADAVLDREHFHLAFVDLRLKEDERELTGKRIAAKITGQDEGTCVVIVTGHADVSTAITALREWNVLDFVLKDEWDAEKVMHLVRTGLSQSRLSYRSKYESSIDLLRGRQDIYSWLASTLDLFAPANEVDRPDRRLADFLNKLLDHLHPLLPLASATGLQTDAAPQIATAYFWSKALGSPISVCMSRMRGFDCETGAALGFNRPERVQEEPALGLVATVSTPAVPPFDSFAC